MNLIDLTGQRFGRLTVIEQAESRRVLSYYPEGGYHIITRARWRCRCDCGQEVEVDSQSLRNGSTKSCGCLRREMGKAWNPRKRGDPACRPAQEVLDG